MLSLDGLLLRYHAGLGGVLVAYSRAAFASSPPESCLLGGGGAYSASHARIPLGRIVDELPVVHVRVSADALLFRPRLGQILHGAAVNIGTDHISILVAGLFNATVLARDMAHAYAFDEAAKAWVATAPAGTSADAPGESRPGKKRRRDSGPAAVVNRIVAANSQAIAEGADVSFRLTQLGYANGIMQMFGTFADEDTSEPLPIHLGRGSSSSSSSA